MNPNRTVEENEALGQVLRQWTVDAPLPRRFQEQVWQRIARAEASAAPGWRVPFSHWLEVVLPRPGFALAYVAVLLVAGVTAGSLAAQVRNSRLETDLSLRYVRALDPFQMHIFHP